MKWRNLFIRCNAHELFMPFMLLFHIPDIDNPVLNSSESVAIKEGSSLHITCSSEALPAASYLWTFNSSQIVGYQSLISFDSIRRNQNGSYVCTAINAAGSRVSKALNITVYCEYEQLFSWSRLFLNETSPRCSNPRPLILCGKPTPTERLHLSI